MGDIGVRLNLDISLENGAISPEYATDGSAALDLYAHKVMPGERPSLILYDTGVRVKIPLHYTGLLFPRSSVYKTDLHLRNCVGVIDPDYRGTIKFNYQMNPKDRADSLTAYKEGDRVGQLLIVYSPKLKLNIVKELDETIRGEGGFGSTGGISSEFPLSSEFTLLR